MSNKIISKCCANCKQTKLLNEFHKYARNRDGHQSHCKECNRIRMASYYQTQVGKEAMARYRRSEQWQSIYRKAQQKYFLSDKGKQARRRHERTAKRKETRKRAMFKWRLKNTRKWKAQNAVGAAVRSGKMPNVSALKCICGKPAEIYHHYHGYDKLHWFDVIPVCRHYHYVLHGRSFDLSHPQFAGIDGKPDNAQ